MLRNPSSCISLIASLMLSCSGMMFSQHATDCSKLSHHAKLKVSPDQRGKSREKCKRWARRSGVGAIVNRGGRFAPIQLAGEADWGLGVSGDTACARTNVIAWKTGHALGLDAVAMAVAPVRAIT
jgi:hypothetical protein